ncbi:sporulation protein [Bacillus sp. T33-2]|uniref:sporulation protein n=1 Tax=Bacillus sp. T33-2 TaxID=2054168 RepID=UPI000C77DC79|nr:sporulation protein [Bacillus sp. T33-2]PLR98865.1 sporulation protein SpoOM [Bacillus sp. T33-2]
MSFFNKVFASVGIGSAKVDTRLEKETLMPGEDVRGVVHITGGKTAQKVDELYLSLHTTYIKEADDKKYTATATIGRYKVTDEFTIHPTETKEIPFSFRLPVNTPVSIGRTKVWVSTGLDVKNAVDPTDQDFINVIPNRIMAAVLNSAGDLGFRLREADCEEAPYRLRSRQPFVQEFEFVPVTGPFRGRLDELEIVFFPVNDNELEVVLQVDRRARGLAGFLSEALEMDESNVTLKVHSGDIPQLAHKLQSVIQRYC